MFSYGVIHDFQNHHELNELSIEGMTMLFFNHQHVSVSCRCPSKSIQICGSTGGVDAAGDFSTVGAKKCQ